MNLWELLIKIGLRGVLFQSNSIDYGRELLRQIRNDSKIPANKRTPSKKNWNNRCTGLKIRYFAVRLNANSNGGNFNTARNGLQNKDIKKRSQNGSKHKNYLKENRK